MRTTTDVGGYDFCAFARGLSAILCLPIVIVLGPQPKYVLSVERRPLTHLLAIRITSMYCLIKIASQMDLRQKKNLYRDAVCGWMDGWMDAVRISDSCCSSLRL